MKKVILLLFIFFGSISCTNNSKHKKSKKIPSTSIPSTPIAITTINTSGGDLHFIPTFTPPHIAPPLPPATAASESTTIPVDNKQNNVISTLHDEGSSSQSPLCVKRKRSTITPEQAHTLGLQLIDALKNGNIEEAASLIEKNADVNVIDDSGNGPIYYAISKTFLNIVQMLLDAGANVHLADKNNRTPLHLASQKSCELVQKLLNAHANIHAVDDFGYTPLYYAINSNSLEIVDQLLNFDAHCAHFIHKLGITPLHLAVRKGFSKIITRLLKENDKSYVGAVDSHGNTPLHYAIKAASIPTVNKLIKAGASVFRSDKKKRTPLHLAASSNSYKIIETLIDEGADLDVNKIDNFGNTPLYYAIKNNSEKVVNKLLNTGADASLPNENGRTPLHIAVSTGSAKTVLRLLDFCPNINAEDEFGHTPLYYAIDSTSVQVVDELLNAGANVSLPDKENRTPLHLAAQKKSCNLLQKLLSFGADVHAVDKSGATPLHVAASTDSVETVQKLLDFSANIHAVDNNGATPLHVAASTDSVETVQKLLDFSANIHAVDNNGATPLHVAASTGSVETVQKLLDFCANIHAVDSLGYTPFSRAMHQNQTLSAILLILHKAQVDEITDHPFMSPTVPVDAALITATRNLLISGEQLHSIQKTFPKIKAIIAATVPDSIAQAVILGDAESLRTQLKRIPQDLNAQDKYGWTALHWAIAQHHIPSMITLLEAGANFTLSTTSAEQNQDYKDMTPLDIAMHNEQSATAKNDKDNINNWKNLIKAYFDWGSSR
jgi:ankyrin repeat protein